MSSRLLAASTCRIRPAYAATGPCSREFPRFARTFLAATDLLYELPPGFDLSTVWQQVVDEMEQRRSVVSATVVKRDHLVRVLHAQFGRHCEIEASLPDARVRVRVAAHLPRSVAEQLAGLGDLVEVERPESVRREIARIGAELVDRCARPAGADDHT